MPEDEAVQLWRALYPDEAGLLDLKHLAERYRIAALLALEALDDFKGTVEHWGSGRH